MRLVLALMTASTVGLLSQGALAQGGPDISLGNVTLSPSVATVGSTVTVSGLVVASPSFSGVVVVQLDATFSGAGGLARTNVTMMGSVAPFSASFVVPTSVSSGSFVISAEADPDNLISESNESNNIWSAVPSLQVRTPDLAAVDLAGGPIYTGGIAQPVQATFTNLGQVEAQGFIYRYQLGQNPAGPALFTGGPLNLPAGASVTVQDVITLPATPGAAQLSVWVNPDLRVVEGALSNNVRSIPITVRIPEPDLQGSLQTFSGRAELGQVITLNGSVQNLGDAIAPVSPYAYMLSTDASIGSSDRELSRSATAMPVVAGDTVLVQDSFQIPVDLMPGVYYLGLLADPDAQIPESNEANNAALGLRVQIFEPEFLITTRTLPEGSLGQAYAARIEVLGGTFDATWSIEQGRLPSGVSLDRMLGTLQGRPEESGAFGFTVQATSGGATATAQLELRVRASSDPVRVETVDLPVATAGRPYDFQLVASGGAPPLIWSAASTPPDGIEVSPSGRVFGTPPTPGTTVFEVRVQDQLGEFAQTTVVLEVLDPSSSIRITQAPLPDGVAGQPYCDPEVVRFGAEGGLAPLLWSSLQDLPEGMQLSITGELCGAPVRAGTYDLLIRVEDAMGVFDTAGFRWVVKADSGVQITTEALPDAALGAAYAQQIVAVGQAPVEFSADMASLPPGLSLSVDGALTGMPTQAGAFAFVVRVTDGQGASDSAVLSVRVQSPGGGLNNEGASGCRCAAPSHSGSATLGLILGLGLIGWRSRRRR